MNTPDILEYIRAALADKPTVLQAVEPVLCQTRQTYGGETVYIRALERRQKVTRRTLQRQQARLRHVT